MFCPGSSAMYSSILDVESILQTVTSSTRRIRLDLRWCSIIIESHTTDLFYQFLLKRKNVNERDSMAFHPARTSKKEMCGQCYIIEKYKVTRKSELLWEFLTIFNDYCDIPGFWCNFSIKKLDCHPQEVEVMWLFCLFLVFFGISQKSVCLTSVTRAKCGIRSTLCWKVENISGPT